MIENIIIKVILLKFSVSRYSRAKSSNITGKILGT